MIETKMTNHSYCDWLHLVTCFILASTFTLYRVLEFTNHRGILNKWPQADTLLKKYIAYMTPMQILCGVYKILLISVSCKGISTQ